YVVFLTTIAFAIYFPSVVLWLPKQVLPASVGCFPNPDGPGYICPPSQRVKASRNIERPADPEAHGVIPIIARGSVAEGRADEIRPAAPGAAADDAGGAISTRPR